MRIVVLSGIVAVAVMTAPTSALAAAGDLDHSFSGDGRATLSFQDVEQGNSVAIDSHGRIIVVGPGFAVARFLPNGNLDSSFAGDGTTTVPFNPGQYGRAASVAIDSQNRIVMVGNEPDPTDPHQHQAFAAARLRQNGTLDPSFSGDGKVITRIGGTASDGANAVAILPDGRILAVGDTARRSEGNACALVRYLPNGHLDSSFSGDGVQVTAFPNSPNQYCRAVALDSHGRIVVAGTANDRFAVARFGPAGGLDPSFSGDGMVTTPMGTSSFGTSVAIDAQGSIVAAGVANNGPNAAKFGLLRYRPNGNLDPSFSGDGKATASFGHDYSGAESVAIDSTGRILAGGQTRPTANAFGMFALARFTPNGTLDPAFSGDGQVTTSFGGPHTSLSPQSGIEGIALDPFGRIVATGFVDDNQGDGTAVARYLGG